MSDNRKYTSVILAALLLFFFLGCQRAYDYRAIRVKDVIDGDTIVLESGVTVRYIGIDTPEIRKNVEGVWQKVDQPGAYEARIANQSLVEGKMVRLEFDIQKKDRYHRLLAYCFLLPESDSQKEIFVNAFLIKEGLALLYTYPPNVKYVDLFVRLQEEAREKKRGLWSKDQVIMAKDSPSYINQIKTVEGKVLDTFESENAVFLNFGRDYKTDFSVVIFKRDLFFFKKENISPVESYKDRYILVTGLIKEYNGPEIIVRHPSQIKILR